TRECRLRQEMRRRPLGAAKERHMTAAKDWTNSKFLGADEADAVYRALLPLRWSIPDEDEKSSKILYGLSYTQGGGAGSNEIPTIPPALKKLADRIAVHPDVRMPVNYIQCRRM